MQCALHGNMHCWKGMALHNQGQLYSACSEIWGMVWRDAYFYTSTFHPYHGFIYRAALLFVRISILYFVPHIRDAHVSRCTHKNHIQYIYDNRISDFDFFRSFWVSLATDIYENYENLYSFILRQIAQNSQSLSSD